jgi:trk system potassium uptake protein TrkA
MERVELLERVARLVSCSQGEILFQRGDPGDEFFVIVDGEVEFFVGKHGEVRIIDTYGPGGAFGELALFGAPSRTLGARAKTALRLCVLTRQSLEQIIAADPSVAMVLMQTLAERVASVRDELYRDPPLR